MKLIQFLVICFSASLADSQGAMPFKDQCLYWHNYFRTLHQVPPVTWSMDLQKEAEAWVKYLGENNKFHHSQHNPGNLYLQGQIPKEYCSDAIWWFHWEEKFYNYSDPRYSRRTGHFTQVVWRNSKQIGAAWAIRKDGKLVVSIKYRPGGNYVRYFANNVFRPVAQTLGGSWGRVPPKFARCPPKSVIAPTTKPVVEATAGAMPFKDQCLYWHNYFRTLHQVPPVTWSMGLQKEAEAWVKYLAENNKFQHSQHNRGNLFITEHIPKEYCSDAIWWFHWEEKYYNYSDPRYIRRAGNFSQVVWKNSTQIGAAWAIRKDGKLVVSIKYRPRGNDVRYFAENVFPPVAQTLGRAWGRVPPEFTECPLEKVIIAPTTRSNITETLNTTKPVIKATAGKAMPFGLLLSVSLIGVLWLKP
ncbi:uncharacterized protein [Acropora muricata]|uniref:uncharacterized protein isoform X3 n=1 Tax=Acropora muricata TaxID=159855 RepID=UPI0034E3A5EA